MFAAPIEITVEYELATRPLTVEPSDPALNHRAESSSGAFGSSTPETTIFTRSKPFASRQLRVSSTSSRATPVGASSP